MTPALRAALVRLALRTAAGFLGGAMEPARDPSEQARNALARAGRSAARAIVHPAPAAPAAPPPWGWALYLVGEASAVATGEAYPSRAAAVAGGRRYATERARGVSVELAVIRRGEETSRTFREASGRWGTRRGRPPATPVVRVVAEVDGRPVAAEVVALRPGVRRRGRT